ncbi:MAG TPA: DNA polymerase III subunit gamma/tau C-terminal domain-containing protein, partial [Candidatus Saccharimonadia bacterium]|nr:DNA polymerase III subunit gamma/tau C-terminal domain-containing protein [Candidatus Saccharimonadia bacterium]
QFNLKRLTLEQIETQLANILVAEQVEADAGAIRAIARAGNGSLRDALSLLDQAIAYGHGAVRSDEVTAMLGTVDRARVATLLDAIVDAEAPALLAEVESLAQFAPDFAIVLDELAELLHRVQVAQFVPAARGEDAEDAARFVKRIAQDEVQLLYQLALSGRRDLGLATSPRAAFEMAVLRMLAFRPLPRTAIAGADAPKSAAPATRRAPASAAAGAVATPVPPRGATPRAESQDAATANRREPSVDAVPVAAAPLQPPPLDTEHWLAAIERAALRGPVRELALNSVPLGLEGGRLRLGLKASHEHFRSDALTRQLADVLAPLYGPLRIQFESVAPGAESAADRARQQRSARQVEAEAAIAADPVVQTLVNRFDARVVPNSTRPRNPENER